jgi:opacity protein-like surface antigen
MRRIVLATVMCGMALSAQAADMPDLPVLRGSLSTSTVNWRGFYIGGQADYGSITNKIPYGINADLQATFAAPAAVGAYNWQPLGMARSNNVGFGVFTGYNWQWDDALLGIEGNYLHGAFKSFSSSTGITASGPPFAVVSSTYSRADVTVNDFASLRTRFGWVAGCFLPYGFLGAGLGNRSIDRTVAASPAPIFPASYHTARDKLIYGYSAGFGVDTMIVGGLFVRAEYEYQRFTSDYEAIVHTARLGLGYKF